MLKRRGFVLVLLVVLVALVASGCGQTENNDAGTEVERGDQLVLAIGGEPDDGFDPTIGWGRYGSPLFQSTLLRRDDDLNVENDLATDYEVSEDGLVWTVSIRDDVVFSDGEPLTADDVVYTFLTAKESGSVVDLNVLSDAVALDETTVEFTLTRPQSTFINNLITTGIVPAHAHGAGYAEDPVGSGPYKFVQWDRGQQLIVEANPEYYGQKPYFQKITFLFLSEDGAFAAANAGDLDLVAVPAALAQQNVTGMSLKAIESIDNRGIMFPFVEAGGQTDDGYPVGNDVTADLALRQAINVAVDRQALVDGVLNGFGTPAYSASDGMPWWNPDTVFADGDFDAARDILEEGGWTEVDGIWQKGDLTAEFSLYYPASDQVRQSLAIAVADMLKPLGINIIVEGKSWDEIQANMYSSAVMFGWGSHDPQELYNLYSSQTAGIGWYNTGFYSNEKVDDYMELALAATTVEEAMNYWQLAQWDGETGLSALGDAPWAWLVNLQHTYLVREGLNIGRQRIHPHGHGWPVTDNIVDWRWDD
ncbi:ABC transporter substrate-binding protein [Dethiobacter alkaliphilus]|uniref:ABC transporter substrate-binding protein n=1 Tax=Dethiobacter alkaliphilus TaxID=427926 RepID=UPI0022276A71|nr:ABC transporter substrate-binding protein [Dethiobacter alkaliphilus]MCW3491228.1 ABC transporter substrate-binding protein [Dethiobacter alkaliphilus]